MLTTLYQTKPAWFSQATYRPPICQVEVSNIGVLWSPFGLPSLIRQIGVQSGWPHPYLEFLRLASPGEYLRLRSRTLSKDGDIIIQLASICIRHILWNSAIAFASPTEWWWWPALTMVRFIKATLHLRNSTIIDRPMLSICKS